MSIAFLFSKIVKFALLSGSFGHNELIKDGSSWSVLLALLSLPLGPAIPDSLWSSEDKATKPLPPPIVELSWSRWGNRPPSLSLLSHSVFCCRRFLNPFYGKIDESNTNTTHIDYINIRQKGLNILPFIHTLLFGSVSCRCFIGTVSAILSLSSIISPTSQDMPTFWDASPKCFPMK